MWLAWNTTLISECYYLCFSPLYLSPLQLSPTATHTFFHIYRFLMLPTGLEMSLSESDAKNRAATLLLQNPTLSYSRFSTVHSLAASFHSTPFATSSFPCVQQTMVKVEVNSRVPGWLGRTQSSKTQKLKGRWRLVWLALSIKLHNAPKVPKIAPGGESISSLSPSGSPLLLSFPTSSVFPFPPLPPRYYFNINSSHHYC